MDDRKSGFDQFLEIIDRKYPLIEDDKPSLFPRHISKKGLNSCIGPCFYMVSDMLAMKFLEVSSGCVDVLGYTPEEIMQAGGDFTFQIVHPQDLPQCMQLIKTAWEFIQDLPLHLKFSYICNFYYRAIKKDGTVIRVQLQIANLETDANNEISVVYNIVTDVSHLGLPDQVKLAIVNSDTNACFVANSSQPFLIKESSLLSKRETEILKLIIQGMNSRQIAENLNISFFTVRTHRKNILEKLGKKNTAELISYTINNGLV